MQRLVNPLAPAIYSGITPDTPAGFIDVGFDYVFDVTLTASQVLNTQQAIANDADFIWRAVCLQVATGNFSVRFSDSNGYYLSSGQVLNTNLISDPASPFVIEPELAIPAGGKIGIDITDLTAAPNTIQIVFRGVKRYYIG